MRNDVELIEDLFSLTTYEWNKSLADEFNFDLHKMVEAANEYAYSVPSEDNIHSVVTLGTKVTEDREEIKNLRSHSQGEEVEPLTNVSKIYSVMSTIRRNISGLMVDGGMVFRGLIFFGLVIDESEFADVVFDGCVFNNCTFSNTNFAFAIFNECKIIECEFTKADFTESTWTKISLYGVSFTSCDFDGSSFFEKLCHVVNYSNCDLDEIKLVGSCFHRVSLSDSSFKKSTLTSSIFTDFDVLNCNFKNTNIANNTFINLLMDIAHVEGARQYANTLVGCQVSSELAEFFAEGDYSDEEEPEEGEADNGLSDRSFDEIMGDDEDD